jgi:hypothetical protein
MCRDLRREEDEEAVHAPETCAIPPDTLSGPLPQAKPCVVAYMRLYLVLSYRATTALAAHPHPPEGIRL